MSNAETIRPAAFTADTELPPDSWLEVGDRDLHEYLQESFRADETSAVWEDFVILKTGCTVSEHIQAATDSAVSVAS